MADGTPQIRVARRARTLTVADLFCGAGGLSTGAMRALRELGLDMRLIGVNHWPVAIETNKRNHQDHAERIHCADLETARPLELVPEGALDLLMAAPSCVFHSRARGGRPVHDQQRMDPWHVIRFCTELRVKRVLVENVPEFMDWGPCSLVTGRPIKSRRGEYFHAWLNAWKAIGFRVLFRVLNAADYGDSTTRKRFIMIATSDRGRLRWPDPSHSAGGAEDLLSARARWRGAAEIIDWSRPGTSIFTRPKPLAHNTVLRIRAGAVRYTWPQPYVDALDALLEGREPRLWFPYDEAMALGLIIPASLLVHLRGTSANAIGRTAMTTDSPVPTLTTGSHVGLVMATGAGGVARDLSQPIPTLTGGGDGGARPHLIEPFVFRANQGDGRNGSQRPVSEPLPTATCSESLALVAPYYGSGSGLTATSAKEPLPAITTKARFGLVMPAEEVSPEDGINIDILYRMLHYRELARAMSFDDEGEVYDFAGNATEITKQIGNAVPGRMAKALVRALMEDMA